MRPYLYALLRTRICTSVLLHSVQPDMLFYIAPSNQPFLRSSPSLPPTVGVYIHPPRYHQSGPLESLIMTTKWGSTVTQFAALPLTSSSHHPRRSWSSAGSSQPAIPIRSRTVTLQQPLDDISELAASSPIPRVSYLRTSGTCH